MALGSLIACQQKLCFYQRSSSEMVRNRPVLVVDEEMYSALAIKSIGAMLHMEKMTRIIVCIY